MGSETVATVRDAMLERVSWPKVTDDAPTDELVGLVAAAGRVADHAGLTPWQLIELREDDRFGSAPRSPRSSVTTDRRTSRCAPRCSSRSSSTKPHPKVPDWEQGSGGRRRRPRVEPAARRSRLRRHLAHRTVHPRQNPSPACMASARTKTPRLALCRWQARHGSCRPPRRRRTVSHPPAGIGGSASGSSACCVPEVTAISN